jgi:F0F1-type ATP synthase delta subunit
MEQLDLSDFFTTKPQAVDFAARLSSVSENIYETSFNLEKTLQKNLGIKKKDKFISLLRSNKIPIDSTSTLVNFFERIQKEISSLPQASMILAIEPSEEILKEISDWFLLNLKRQILIDIQINPDIVAGAIVSYKGKQINCSLNPVLNQVYNSFEKTSVMTER